MELVMIKLKDSIKITQIRKRMNPSKFIGHEDYYFTRMKDANLFNIFIGYKDFHPNQHWKIESSSSPIGSWREMRPLIGRRDFHKLSLAKRKQSQGRVLWVAFVIYGFLLVLKGERFMIRKSVCEEGKKLVYVCMCVLFINPGCVQIKNMEEHYV